MTTRILVAEDDCDMCTLITEVLHLAKYEVDTASDGGRLLVNLAGAYKRNGPIYDLIITDICMPICSGIQLVEALRLAKWETPVIFITGCKEDRKITSQAEALSSYLLFKPFGADELLEMISAGLHNSQPQEIKMPGLSA